MTPRVEQQQRREPTPAARQGLADRADGGAGHGSESSGLGSWPEGRLDLPGGSLVYTMAGTGPPVILIHGLGGSRQTWRHLIGPLSRRYTVIAPDLPGHGASGAPVGDYSPGAHASAIRDLMVGLGLDRASLVGHSLGGGIAVQFAYQFPERTSRIALISSAGFGTDVTPMLRAAILPGAETILSALGLVPGCLTRPALSALAAVGGGLSPEDAGPLSQDLRGMSDPRRRRGFLRTARAVLDRQGQALSAAPYLERLVGLPVMVAWGTADKTIPPQHHHALARSLPKRHVVEIVDAGHYPHETEPARVLGPLQSFLRSTTAFEYDDTLWPHVAG